MESRTGQALASGGRLLGGRARVGQRLELVAGLVRLLLDVLGDGTCVAL